MHRHNDLGARSDQTFQLPLVQIQRIGPDIGKNNSGAPQRKGIRRGNKGKGGNNDLITRLDVKQQGAHLQGVGAGSGHHRLWHPQHLLQKSMAPF